jgi:hypothetical protein
MGLDCVFCPNGEIVKDAESHGSIPEGVMAWRSNQGKGIADFPRYHGSNSLHDPSGSHPSGLICFRRGDGVRIEADLGLFRTVQNTVDIARVMNEENFLQAGQPGSDIDKGPTKIVCLQHLVDGLKAIRVLRMKDSRLVFEVERMFDNSSFCHDLRKGFMFIVFLGSNP